MKNGTRIVSLLGLAGLFLGGPAQAGLFDRKDEGAFVVRLEKPSAGDTVVSGRVRTVGVVELDNADYRLVPNATHEGYRFDLSGIGAVTAEALGDLLARSGACTAVVDVDKSALIRRPLAELAAREGIQLFLGGAILDAKRDVIEKSIFKLAVPSPSASVKIRLWLKDATGAELWSGDFQGSASEKGIAGLGEFDKSDVKKRIAARLVDAGEDKPWPDRLHDFYFAELGETLITRALGAAFAESVTGLRQAWGPAVARIESAGQSGEAAPAQVERRIAREYRDVTVHLRGRKWEGEQGLLRIGKKTSKVKNDQIAYRILADGELLDEGMVSGYRADTHGSWSKDSFTTFEETFTLSLPLGTRTLTFLMDQPDIDIRPSGDVGRAQSGESARGRSTKRERGVGGRMTCKLNQASEPFGVILREVNVTDGGEAHLSIQRNLYVHQPQKKSMGLFGDLLDMALFGSGTQYLGSWEIGYRDHDPFVYTANIDWKDPKLADLIAADAGLRKKACKQFQKEPYLGAGPALVETLALDVDDDVREEAVKALVAIDDVKGIYFMVRTAVWDAEEDNRERAWEYLKKGKKAEAVLYLEELYFSSSGQRPGQTEKSYRKPIRQALEKITGRDYPKRYSWWE